MHAGELGDPKNVRDAIIFGVQRIGHGNKLKLNPLYLEYARRKEIAIETNLTSNFILGVEENIDTHPFLDFLRLGLKVSLSTDDEGIFNTDISKECTIALRRDDLTYFELKQMFVNSIETAFLEKDIRDELLKKLNHDFSKFEANWRNHL